MPLQEFAPATTCIPIEIPIENLYWNSHGCRSKLLQRPWSFDLNGTLLINNNKDIYKR